MTKNNRARLEAIAEKMISFAAEHPRPNTRPISDYQKSLSGGLVLTYTHRGDSRKLSLTRAGVDPSLREVEICRDVFNVPEHAYKSFAVQMVGINKYHIIRLEWQAAPRPKQLVLIEAGPTNNYQEEN